MPTNTLNIYAGQVSNIVFVSGTLVVTGLTDPKNLQPTIVHNNSTGQPPWQLQLTCDRQNSAGPATAFNNFVGGASHAYCADTNGATEPSQLNFSYQVVMTIGNVPVQLAIGQGSNQNNNWWIGGPQLFNVDNNALICTGAGLIKITGSNGSTAQFTFTSL